MKKYFLLLILVQTLFCHLIEAEWTPIQIVSSDWGTGSPKVAQDGSGTAFAIWQGMESVGIQSAELAKGSTLWSTFKGVLNPAKGKSFEPCISVNSNGDGVAIWITMDAVLASYKPQGQAWQLPQILSLENNVRNPVVKISDSGNIIAAWIADYSVKGVVVAFGKTWPNPEVISPPLEVAVDVQVGIDVKGNAIAIWSNIDQGCIECATLVSGEKWSSSNIISDTGIDAQSASLAMNSDGYAVAVWQRADPYRLCIESADLQFGKSWSMPLVISKSEVSANPRVVLDSKGNVVAGWISANFNEECQATFRTKEGAWQTPVTLGSIYDPKILLVMDGLGNAYATWIALDRGVGVVKASILPLGQNWTEVATLSDRGQEAWTPEISVDPTGYAVVVWKNISTDQIEAAEWRPISTITKITPAYGTVNGGTDVTIMGENFFDITSVFFGKESALSFTVDSTRCIHALSPQGFGTVEITLTKANKDLTSHANHYSYILTPSPNPSPNPTPSSSVLPPSNFIGQIVRNSSLNRADLVLVAHWDASLSGSIVSYRIYRGTQVVATVGASSARTFRAQLISESEASCFLISAINAKNEESKRIKLVLK